MNRCSIRRKPQKSDCSKNLRERVAQGRIRSKGWRKTCRERLAQRQLGSDERHTEPQQMAQPATPAGCSVIEGDVFVSQKKGRHTELTWNTCRKWIWKIIFPWSSKVAVQRVPKTQWWITFSLKSSKNHLMGIPIFSSAIFRWSSDTSTISLRNYIHQQKTWSIPTLTQSTPRFCCFRKKKTSFALSCDRLCALSRAQATAQRLTAGDHRHSGFPGKDPMGQSRSKHEIV